MVDYINKEFAGTKIEIVKLSRVATRPWEVLSNGKPISVNRTKRAARDFVKRHNLNVAE